MIQLIVYFFSKIPAIVRCILIAGIFYGCTVQKTNPTFCGVITPNFRVYDSVQKKFIMADGDRDPLIFYKDSLFIGERLITYNRSTNDILDTTYTEVNFYEFADLKTNTEIYFKIVLSEIIY